LGWSHEKYRSSSVYEFNEAALGYWRKWERDTAWLMREIVYAEMCGNPYIKQEHKPKSSRDIFPIEGERDIEVKHTAPSAEEIEMVTKNLLK
jgi:hypothetical protein